MSGRFADIWVYLSASPLLWLTATLLAYEGAFWIYRKPHMKPLANPVAIAVAALVALLWFSDTPYPVYFEGAQFVHFLLGTATVALAVPLYANFATLKRNLLPLGGALLAGSVVAAVSAVGIGWLLGASRETLLSLAPKSVTAPIAMGVAAHGIGTARAFQVSEKMGAFAGLAMGLNGMLTAFLFPLLLRLW